MNAAWTDEELRRIGAATELQITSRRATASGTGRIRAAGIERDVTFTRDAAPGPPRRQLTRH